MNTDPIESTLPPLQAEVCAVLAIDGGWLTRNALLNRCRYARDAETLENALDALARCKLIQRESGDLGLEYAAPGIPRPMREVREARGPQHVPDQAAPSAPIAAIRHQQVHAKLQAVRAELVRLFEERSTRTRGELQAILGKSQPIVSGYLRAMRDEGLVEQRGSGGRTYFAWAGRDAGGAS